MGPKTPVAGDGRAAVCLRIRRSLNATGTQGSGRLILSYRLCEGLEGLTRQFPGGSLDQPASQLGNLAADILRQHAVRAQVNIEQLWRDVIPRVTRR